MSRDFEDRARFSSDANKNNTSQPGANRGDARSERDGAAGTRPFEKRVDRDRRAPQGRGNFHGARHGKPNEGRSVAPRAVRSAREVALKAVQDVVRGDAYAAQALDRQLEAAQLKPDDRRLAASIFYFAVENWLYIETVLQQFLEAKPDSVVADILHVATAQILFMDRIPDHAAVDEAVKQVRASRRDGFTGLVNGVLRNLIRARDAGTIKIPDRETDFEAYISVRYSIAPAVVTRLIAAYGMEMAEEIAAYMPTERTQTIRPNREHMDVQAFEDYLEKNRFTWCYGHVPDAYIISGMGSMAEKDGYRRGIFSIQGESSMLAAQAVMAKPGMQILDACAAPGGKTCLMAEQMHGAGRVYAWDVHEHRVDLIRAAVRRLGLENVRPSVHDALNPLESLNLMMDAVLVDAPCSGLGVILDKPDIKYRSNEASLTALPPIQRDILDACAQAVKVGGLLVYSTCTILPEENECRVREFLEKHPEFEPATDDVWLPEPLKPLYKEGMMQILPNRDGIEGFFIARMRRKTV